MGVTSVRIGELLVRKGLLSQAQLAAALQEQRASKEFLGALCVRKGWVSEDALLDALAEQFGMARVHLDQERLDGNVAKHFSPALLKDHHCVPLRLEGQAVVVAIANPLDAWAVSALEQEAGFRTVRLVLASMKEIDAAVARVQQVVE